MQRKHSVISDTVTAELALDEQLHVLESAVLQFLPLDQNVKLLCAHFGSQRVAGRPGIADASFVAHITAGPIYFQYTSSRPHQSYTVVSLPGIQLTPNKSSPTGGRCSLDMQYCVDVVLM